MINVRWARSWILVCCVALLSGNAQATEAPDGYRQSNYDAPVPDHVTGAVTIGDEAAYALWRSGRVAFVDVMPNLPRPKGLPEDAVWRGRSRQSVPDAIWLPDIGFGTLGAAAEAQFETGLMAATGGDKGAPVVFLCRADCWMSWNASKRAVAHGYSRVFWYADGSTGWEFWDWPTKRLKVFQTP